LNSDIFENLLALSVSTGSSEEVLRAATAFGTIWLELGMIFSFACDMYSKFREGVDFRCTYVQDGGLPNGRHVGKLRRIHSSIFTAMGSKLGHIGDKVKSLS
jgi:hypothetical protein